VVRAFSRKCHKRTGLAAITRAHLTAGDCLGFLFQDFASPRKMVHYDFDENRKMLSVVGARRVTLAWNKLEACLFSK